MLKGRRIKMAKAIRILVYEGDLAWLTHVLSRCHVSPDRPLIGKVISIKEVYRATLPIIINEEETNVQP